MTVILTSIFRFELASLGHITHVHTQGKKPRREDYQNNKENTNETLT